MHKPVPPTLVHPYGIVPCFGSSSNSYFMALNNIGTFIHLLDPIIILISFRMRCPYKYKKHNTKSPGFLCNSPLTLPKVEGTWGSSTVFLNYLDLFFLFGVIMVFI